MEVLPASRPVAPAPREVVEASASLGTFIGFGAMCLGMFMAILDVQIVATSLPTIQDDLGMAQDQASWIQTAYLIAEIVSIPLTGVLTRLLGLRRLFAISVLVFTLASCGCAASNGFAELIAWRVLQGFSGGTLIPSVFSAVFLLFPIASRASRRPPPAFSRCSPRPWGRSSAATSPAPFPGTGCS